MNLAIRTMASSFGQNSLNSESYVFTFGAGEVVVFGHKEFPKEAHCFSILSACDVDFPHFKFAGELFGSDRNGHGETCFFMETLSGELKGFSRGGFSDELFFFWRLCRFWFYGFFHFHDTTFYFVDGGASALESGGNFRLVFERPVSKERIWDLEEKRCALDFNGMYFIEPEVDVGFAEGVF